MEYSYREIVAASRGSCIRVTNGDRDIMTRCYFFLLLEVVIFRLRQFALKKFT